MYYDCRTGIEHDLMYEKEILEQLKVLEKRTAHVKDMSLSVRPDGRITINYYDGGDHKQEYVGKKNLWSKRKILRSIRLHRAAKALIRNCQNNIRLMEALLNGYQPINPNELRPFLAKGYQEIEEDIFSIVGVPDMKNMPDGSFNPESANWHPEHLKQHSADGDPVRSKSEAINTYIFKKLGIKYHHEDEVILCGKTCFSDFKLYAPDGSKTIRHEHFGMMSDPEYRARAAERYREYIESGYIPDVDVIFTYDRMDGVIDTWLIEKKLTTWLESPGTPQPEWQLWDDTFW